MATPAEKPRIVIAGGGVAGVEATLALRELLGSSAQVVLLSPARGFNYRPLAVAEPFGISAPFEIDLGAIAEDAGAALRIGALDSVDAKAKRVLTDGGEALDYDYLVVATGATPQTAVPGALSFDGPDAIARFERILYRLTRGELQRVIFTSGSGASWSLPLYELALMTATYARGNLLQPELTVITSESSPLGIFGPHSSAEIARLLDAEGISLLVGRQAARFVHGELELVPGPGLEADEVVALPDLRGPAHPGLASDEHGFHETDMHCRVSGAPGVFVAGDANAFPVKQGGIAAQQANVAAATIAQELGAVSEAPAFRPRLEGTLLSGSEAHRLRSSLVIGTADQTAHDVRAAWMPIAKIAAPHLTLYLAEHAGIASASAEIDPGQRESELRDEHERHGKTRYGSQ